MPIVDLFAAAKQRYPYKRSRILAGFAAREDFSVGLPFADGILLTHR